LRMSLWPKSTDLVKMLIAAVIAVALVTVIGLRVTRLDKVPRGMLYA
jgi:hypothetical protein